MSVETYTGHPNVYADNKFDILIQLFFITTEANFPIRAVHTDTLFRSDTIVNYQTFPPVRYVSNSATTSTTTLWTDPVKFSSYDNVYVLIDNFSRQLNVGGAANATINCITGYFVTATCTTGLQFNATFTLDSRKYLGT